MKMHWYDYAIILAIINGVIILSLFIYLRPHSVGTHKYMEISRENEVAFSAVSAPIRRYTSSPYGYRSFADRFSNPFESSPLYGALRHK